MRFQIEHESRHTIRLTAVQYRMNTEQADLLEDYIRRLPGVEKVTVHERSRGVIITYHGERDALTGALATFSYERAAQESKGLSHTGRELNLAYQEKILFHVLRRYAAKLFLPAPIRYGIHILRSLPYLSQALRCLLRREITVELLDGTAIAASLLTRDFETAGSVMFLLKLGDYLDEWTHKKSIDDLAKSMSLQVDQVWLHRPDGQEVLVPMDQIAAGDVIVANAGGVIPLDGEIVEGEVTVNQASLTGESVPVAKRAGSTVFAGTVLEEGRCLIRCTQTPGGNRYDRIVKMIEASEKLNSQSEVKAAQLADRLVPWCLGGSVLTWLLTRNIQRAVSVLMVDFSCALKLSMPLAVLSAMGEAGRYRIVVKGGKYMERCSNAQTIIFDKTGTLTRACPTLVDVIPFHGQERDEMLRTAACLEEHFPHSIANAVVRAAKERKLEHEEMHSEVEYIVAHGIASRINGERVVIGSYHFVFEDEKATIDRLNQAAFDALPPQYSLLYLAIGGVLSAVLCIADPLREEAKEVVRLLHQAGFTKAVMLTGDSHRTAQAIGTEVGVDDFRAEVLPEDKARYIQEEQAQGRRVVMVGDGINDTPALSFADVGVAIGSGAAIAREVADITISAEDLRELVYLKRLSDALMRRIRSNYRFVIGFNGALIVLGALGILPPATSALLHNGSTLALSLNSMTKLLPKKENQYETA